MLQCMRVNDVLYGNVTHNAQDSLPDGMKELRLSLDGATVDLLQRCA